MGIQQLPLFDTPLLPGLGFIAEMIDETEEQELIDQIAGLPLDPFRFQGWTGKRMTRSFGWRYDFDDRSFAPAEPIPQWLMPLRGRAAALASLPAEDLVQLLVTRYDPGAGIGWHRDRPVFDRVVGISLGAEAVLRFRQRAERGFVRRSLPLPARSAYLLSGEARQAWEHGIAPIAATRWSITFRSLSDAGSTRTAATASRA